MTNPNKYCKPCNSLWLTGLGFISDFANLFGGDLKKLNSLSASLHVSNLHANLITFSIRIFFQSGLALPRLCVKIFETWTAFL